eukprot:Selendium_serpulae@DN6175_c0_g1_i4.p1
MFDRASFFDPEFDDKDTTRSILRFVNAKTGRRVELKYGFAYSTSLLSFATVVLIAIAVIGAKLSKLIRRFPVIVAIIAVILQVLSTCGLFYSVQNGARLFGIDRQTQQTEIFSRGQRSQYFGEGVMMASATVLAGVCFTLIAYIPRMVARRNKSKSLANTAVILLFTVALLCCKLVWWGHLTKTGFAAGGIYPSANAKRGPLIMDRGNSF